MTDYSDVILIASAILIYLGVCILAAWWHCYHSDNRFEKLYKQHKNTTTERKRK